MSETNETPTPFEQWWESAPPGLRVVLFEPAHVVAGKGWAAALGWAAGKVETAGCTCRSLLLAFRAARYTCGYDGEYRYEGDDFVVIRHDSRCPCALAASLREVQP